MTARSQPWRRCRPRWRGGAAAAGLLSGGRVAARRLVSLSRLCLEDRGRFGNPRCALYSRLVAAGLDVEASNGDLLGASLPPRLDRGVAVVMRSVAGVPTILTTIAAGEPVATQRDGVLAAIGTVLAVGLGGARSRQRTTLARGHVLVLGLGLIVARRALALGGSCRAVRLLSVDRWQLWVPSDRPRDGGAAWGLTVLVGTRRRARRGRGA